MTRGAGGYKAGPDSERVRATLRLLNAVSHTEVIDGRNITVVYLYGRTADGQSMAVRTEPQSPWFQVVEPPDKMVAQLEAHADVRATRPERLWVDGTERDCLRVEVWHPGKVPQLRDWLRASELVVLAADIPFHFRYIYDHDLGGCVTVEGEMLEKRGWSCPVIGAATLAPAETFTAPLRVLSFDVENSLLDRRLFCLCLTVHDGGELVAEQMLDGGEAGIIASFTAAIAKHDPDVITGYNIDGYDLPLLEERAKLHGMKLMLGRDGSEAEQRSNRTWAVRGRVVADAWWNVKREIRPRQESLNAVAKQLLGREKHDVNPQQMDAEWERDPQRVMDYCLEDARLAFEIMQHIRVLEKFQHLGSVARLPLEEVLNGRTSSLIDSLMIRAADRKAIGVPLTRHQRRTGHIEGGYVHALEPGIYDWVCVLDFKSMYPSIIIDRNLCFTTLADDGEILTPHGVRFQSPDVRRGLLPELLEGLMAERDSAKRAEAAATGAEAEHYRRVQEAIKILMNSVYGVFASYFYRFTNLDIGASITAYAREAVRDIIAELEREGLAVIYGDTDSVFFGSPHDNLDETVAFGEAIAARYSGGARQLEFEKILHPFFSHGVKKRYVGQQVWPRKTLVVRGYETRRTDAFPAQVEALQEIFARLMEGSTEAARETARDWVTRVSAGKVAPEDLVISKTVNLGRKYKNPKAMAHLQAHAKFVKTGRPFVSGMKVAFIVTDASRTPMVVEPYFPGEEPAVPDRDYYAGRLAKSLARITEVFGWDERALRTGGRQATLFSADGDGAATGKPAAPAREPQGEQQRLF